MNPQNWPRRYVNGVIMPLVGALLFLGVLAVLMGVVGAYL